MGPTRPTLDYAPRPPREPPLGRRTGLLVRSAVRAIAGAVAGAVGSATGVAGVAGLWATRAGTAADGFGSDRFSATLAVMVVSVVVATVGVRWAVAGSAVLWNAARSGRRRPSGSAAAPRGSGRRR